MTTNETPAATVDELLASLPDMLVVPSDRLSVEESDRLISLYAKAIDSPVPTPEQLSAERATRAAGPAPQAGEQGRDQARRRFGTTPSGTTPGDQGRAMAAKRFRTNADDNAAALAVARARVGQ